MLLTRRYIHHGMTWLVSCCRCRCLCRWLDDKRPGCSLQYELWPDADGKQRTPSAACLWELVLYTGMHFRQYH